MNPAYYITLREYKVSIGFFLQLMNGKFKRLLSCITKLDAITVKLFEQEIVLLRRKDLFSSPIKTRLNHSVPLTIDCIQTH